MRKGILDYVFYFAIILIVITLLYFFFIKKDDNDKIILKEERISLSIGDKKYLYNYVNKDDKISYFSANEEIITISSDGIITAVGNGHTSIILNYNNGDDTISKQLLVDVLSGGEYGFSKSILLLNLGESVTFDNKDNITFSIDDESVLSIDDNKIKGISEGKAIVSAKEKGAVVNSLIVYVKSDVKTTYLDIPANLSFITSEVSVKVSESVQVSYDITPSTIPDDFLEFESADPSIATVKKGIIKGVSAGNTIVTVKTLNGLKSSILVTVNGKDIEQITITSPAPSIKIGEQTQITYNLSPVDANSKDLVFESSDSSIAIVSDTGLVTGLKSGDVIITVKSKDGTKQATINVHVKQDSSGWSGVNKACNDPDPADTEFNHCFVRSHHLVLDKSSITVSVGSSGTVKVKLPPECGTNIGYTRKSPDGESGWSKYLKQEITNETSTGFTWVITPYESGRGKTIITSLTIQYDSRSPSGKCVGNVKSMITLNVKIT